MGKAHCKNTYYIGNDVTWVESIIFKHTWRGLQQYSYLFHAQLDASALTLLRAYMQCNSREQFYRITDMN